MSDAERSSTPATSPPEAPLRLSGRDLLQLATFGASVIAFFGWVLPWRDYPVFVGLLLVFLLVVPAIHRTLWKLLPSGGSRS